MAKKNPAAVALGRLGGKAKVKKGFAMLPPEERKRIAARGGRAGAGSSKSKRKE